MTLVRNISNYEIKLHICKKMILKSNGRKLIRDYIKLLGSAGHLPSLLPNQAKKLKQLSVLTLAETNKVICLGIFSNASLVFSICKEHPQFMVFAKAMMTNM